MYGVSRGARCHRQPVYVTSIRLSNETSLALDALTTTPKPKVLRQRRRCASDSRSSKTVQSTAFELRSSTYSPCHCLHSTSIATTSALSPACEFVLTSVLIASKSLMLFNVSSKSATSSLLAMRTEPLNYSIIIVPQHTMIFKMLKEKHDKTADGGARSWPSPSLTNHGVTVSGSPTKLSRRAQTQGH